MLCYVCLKDIPYVGMALATLFVTMPFVVRELIPVLESMDFSEEEAALTLGASKREVFWNVTLPNIRWGLMYGILLTNAVSLSRHTVPTKLEAFLWSNLKSTSQALFPSLLVLPGERSHVIGQQSFSMLFQKQSKQPGKELCPQ